MYDEYIAYSKRLGEYLEYISNKHTTKVREFAERRRFPFNVIEDAGIFYIGEQSEMVHPFFIEELNDLGVISPNNNKPIYKNRWVIPIYDCRKNIINTVGYTSESDERYMYGTSKYYRRRDDMYGQENLEMAYDLGFAILTEGITDVLRLRSIGYMNSFAMCGTHWSEYIGLVLNRMKHGVIKIPDRDKAGIAAWSQWETFRSVTLKPFIQYKDVDQACFEGGEIGEELFKSYINMSIEWLKSDKHSGHKKYSPILTVS